MKRRGEFVRRLILREIEGQRFHGARAARVCERLGHHLHPERLPRPRRPENSHVQRAQGRGLPCVVKHQAVESPVAFHFMAVVGAQRFGEHGDGRLREQPGCFFIFRVGRLGVSRRQGHRSVEQSRLVGKRWIPKGASSHDQEQQPHG
jgi:hypothetical protein